MSDIDILKKEIELLKKENKSIKRQISNISKTPKPEFIEEILEKPIKEKKSSKKIIDSNEAKTPVFGIVLTIVGILLTLTFFGAIIGIPLLIWGIFSIVKSDKSADQEDQITKSKKPVKQEPKPIKTVHQKAIAAKEKPKERDSFELAIGIKWFAWIGILALVIGVGFFVKYAIDNGWISHLTRIILGCVLGIGLIILGKIAALKEKYQLWGRVLMGGGIAILYFMVYAAYHFIEYRNAIGISLITEIALLIVVVIISVIVSLYENSQTIIAESFFLGYITSLLGGNYELLTLIYTLLLTFSLVAIVSYKKWSIIGIGGILATYSVYLIWYSSDKISFAYSTVFLISYFLAYTIQSLALIRDETKIGENIAMTLLNSAFFYLLYYAQLDKYAPKLTGLFTLFLAIFYFAVYFSTANLKQVKISLTNLYLAILYLTITIPVQLNGEWITIIWALEALILGLLSIKLNMKSLKISAYVISFIIAIKTLAYDSWALHILDLNNILNSTRLIAFLSTIISFYILYYVFKKVSMKTNSETSENTSQKYLAIIYSFVATFFLILIIFLELYEYAFTIICMLTLIVIIFLMSYNKGWGELKYQSIISSIVLFITLLTFSYANELGKLNFNNFLTSTRFFAFIICILLFYLITYIYKVKKELSPSNSIFAIIYSSFALLLITLLLFLELSEYSYLITILLSLIALILAVLYFPGKEVLKYQSMAISLLIVFKLISYDAKNLAILNFNNILSSTRFFAFAITIIIFYIISYIYSLKKELSKINSILARIYSSIALFFLVLMIFLELNDYSHVITILLTLIALILGILYVSKKEIFKYQSIIVSILIIFKLLTYDAINLSELNFNNILSSTRFFAFAISIIIFYILSYIYHVKKEISPENGLARTGYLWIAAALSFLLILMETTEFMTSVSWAVYALVILVVGFVINKKSLRLQGIIILIITILKVFLYDTRNLGTLARTISFIILGIILLVSSFLFAKYKDRIKEII
jgi:uncharacterized membrane protein